MAFWDKGPITAVLVTQDVMKLEINKFFVNFFYMIRDYGSTPDDTNEQTVFSSDLFQKRKNGSYNHLLTLSARLTKVVIEWNNDPSNKSKPLLMVESLQESLAEITEAQRLVWERGEKIEIVLDKAEQLKNTSYGYLSTARSTKKVMCWRKYKYYLAAGVTTLILVLLLCIIIIK